MEMWAGGRQSPPDLSPPQKSHPLYNHFFSLIISQLHHFDKKTLKNIWIPNLIERIFAKRLTEY
jgi:hypothetical protein